MGRGQNRGLRSDSQFRERPIVLDGSSIKLGGPGASQSLVLGDLVHDDVQHPCTQLYGVGRADLGLPYPEQHASDSFVADFEDELNHGTELSRHGMAVPHFSGCDSDAWVYTKDDANVEQSLHILLLTQMGERVDAA